MEFQNKATVPTLSLEDEIQAKGLTAPRVTPAQIESVIASEVYFTGADGFHAVARNEPIPIQLTLLTICVLVLRNGFTVVGKSAVASRENFDEAIGRRVAREDAVRQIWPLEGYLLKQKLQDAAAK